MEYVVSSRQKSEHQNIRVLEHQRRENVWETEKRSKEKVNIATKRLLLQFFFHLFKMV